MILDYLYAALVQSIGTLGVLVLLVRNKVLVFLFSFGGMFGWRVWAIIISVLCKNQMLVNSIIKPYNVFEQAYST